ncbi:hypothetical protein HDU98_000734, partial [Podochytrium sp. JEL0797]
MLVHPSSPSFHLAVLGSSGGPFERHVSGFLIHPAWDPSPHFLAFDPGSLLSGIQYSLPAIDRLLGHPTTAAHIHRNLIAGYLLTHTHLDHCAGMLMASANDKKNALKPIYGLDETLAGLRRHAFNGIMWPDMPKFGFYRYETMIPRKTVHNLAGIEGLDAKAFPVSHNDITSTCFLLGRNLDAIELSGHNDAVQPDDGGGAAILLCGDLGADTNEHTTMNEHMWASVAPLIHTRRLKAIMIECSFPNSVSSELLFGHLTPSLVMQELRVLEGKVDDLAIGELLVVREPADGMMEVEWEARVSALDGFTVIIQHIKEGDLDRNGESRVVEVVMRELNELNDLGVKFVFAHEYRGR